MADNAAGRQPVIELRAVGLRYPGPPPVVALSPCDLRIWPGEFVTAVGPSGAGKSSLLNIIGLLDAATEGNYLLDGRDTAALGEAQRTALRGRGIGFVFQAFHLLPHRTAWENVELGLIHGGTPRKERRATARDALVRVGLEHRLKALPTTLSGGERQRVAIARAVAGSPSLLLCDEPTGNLDSATAATVLNLLDELFLLPAFICLFVGTVGIANTTLVAVLERTGEIGLRRALGARARHVAAQFLLESGTWGALGGLIGTALGILTVVPVALARSWTPVIDLGFVAAAPFLGLATGLLAGLYPAWRASRIQPVEALRR
ncbi:ATP-binding cassette domain-containing protein [Streptomyces sp. NPDC093089]|uniref:ABC transporter ATP-binding protein/permease n=1 Tax=Streptomyces sp. NPDC093089 TaxID=3366024 RepID=UPI0038289433